MNRCDEDKKWNCEFTLLMSPLKALCSRPAVHICLWGSRSHETTSVTRCELTDLEWCDQQTDVNSRCESLMVKLSESCVHTHLLTFLPLLIEVKMESDTSLFSCSSSLLNQFTLENNQFKVQFIPMKMNWFTVHVLLWWLWCSMTHLGSCIQLIMDGVGSWIQIFTLTPSPDCERLLWLSRTMLTGPFHDV